MCKGMGRETGRGVQGAARGSVQVEGREGSWEGPCQPRGRSLRAEGLDIPLRTPGHHGKGLEQGRNLLNFMFGAVGDVQREAGREASTGPGQDLGLYHPPFSLPPGAGPQPMKGGR